MFHVKHFATIGAVLCSKLMSLLPNAGLAGRKYSWPLTSGGLKPVRLRGKPEQLCGTTAAPEPVKDWSRRLKIRRVPSKRAGSASPEERKGSINESGNRLRAENRFPLFLIPL
jgi:hypothetical protein